jgi:uncharacterized Ntn-hydrolase superfamily protein
MTFSVVARCPETGQLGVATCSQYAAVGAVVPWIRSDTGAVATQGTGSPRYGIEGLELLAQGETATAALTHLVAGDPRAELRQVGVVDREGRAAAHTGDHCTEYAEHVVADGVVFLANMMANAGSPLMMAASWQESLHRPFDERLLLALRCALTAGGDVRGNTAAAIKICETRTASDWWDNVTIDLRVDHAADPLGELGRLTTVRRGQLLLEKARRLADKPSTSTSTEATETAFLDAIRLSPDHAEPHFWFGMWLREIGRLAEADAQLDIAYGHHAGWRALSKRL